LKYALLTLGLPVLAHLPLPLLLHLSTAGFPLGSLLLPAVLLLDAHLLHLLLTRRTFGSLLLAAVLLCLPGLTLLCLLSGLLAASVHLVHPLLATSFVLLTHLLHHLLALLAAILLLGPLPFDAVATAAAPIRALRGACLAHLPSSSAAAAFLTLDLLAAATASSATSLSRRAASIAPAISTASAAAFTLAERVRLCADHDRDHGERGENEFI
jgi:hypothetical protein